MTKILTMPKLIAWLKKKPARGRYSYISNNNCLIAQFLKSSGIKSPYVLGSTYSENDLLGISNPIPKGIYKVAIGDPETYGAALKRARSLSR